MKTILYILGFSFLSLSVLAQPANNNCVNAIDLIVDAPCTSGTNVAATAQLGEPLGAGCLASAMDKTVWYKFTTSVAGIYNVSTDNGGTTDTQLKIYSGACPGTIATQVACNEDAGTGNTLAAIASASLNAATTYLVQVDNFGTGAGNTFCINVTLANPPANDCVLNAIDLTPQISGINAGNLFDCASYTYNTPGPGGEPTIDNLAGDGNQCNGADLLLSPIPEHFDIWFTFTVDASTPPAWLSVFHKTGTTPSYAAALYSGTPAGTCGGAGSITGLTYIDCSAGDFVEILPTDNTQGGARDKGVCTTPLNPRIDISGLPDGTYYFRVWEIFGASPPSDGIINLCAESALPAGVTSDKCPSQNTIGCAGGVPNSNVDAEYLDLGNNGMTGNACNTDVNEPQLAAGAAGQIRDGCAGPWITNVGYANNVMNNSAIYQFEVNAMAPCTANILIDFKSIDYGGVDGNIAQFQVMNGTCAGGVSAIMTGTTDQPCLEMRPVGGTLPNGIYYIVVDGQDGQLIQYDLNLQITYSGVGCTSIDCGSVLLAVIFNKFDASKKTKTENLLEWSTLYEKNNNYFEIERSYDMINFETIGKEYGSESSDEERFYEFVDSRFNTKESIVYYRIKQYDLDGKISYSKTSFVDLESDSAVLKTLNLMGQEVDNYYKGVVFEVYSGGKIIKTFKY